MYDALEQYIVSNKKIKYIRIREALNLSMRVESSTIAKKSPNRQKWTETDRKGQKQMETDRN